MISRHRIAGKISAFTLAVFAAHLLGGCSKDPGLVVDELFEAYDGRDLPGAAVLVIRDGEKVLTRTYGAADIVTQEPIEPDTNFRLASLSKQFTAMAILKLVDDGKLTLDTTMAELFPDANDYARDVTVRHLLRHQSGLPDYEPMVPADGEQVHDADVLELMLTASQGYFEPGTEFLYSNSGYAVLAMIVDSLSDLSYAEFLAARIFEPLEMINTVAFEDGISTVENRAWGYTVTGDRVEFADQSVWSAVLGDGGIYSSLDDLYRWDQALYGDDLISPALKAEMWTPSLDNYGFGWWIDTYNGQRRFHHYGSTSGFRNFIQRFPDAGLTVIVLTNRAEPAVRPLAETIADLYL